MVTGVVVGVLGLAEALPNSAGAALVRLVSWAFILLGVTGEQAVQSICCSSVGGWLGWAALGWARQHRLVEQHVLRGRWVGASSCAPVLATYPYRRCVAHMLSSCGAMVPPLEALETCRPPALVPPAVLANGAGGTRELAAVLLTKLPAGVWKVLPVR